MASYRKFSDTWHATQTLGPGTIKLYEGSVVRELVTSGLTLEPLRLGLDACALYLEELGA